MTSGPPYVSPPEARRAQSTVIGVVLVIGLAVAGTTAVLVVGGSALQDVRDQASAGQAELAMSTVDSEVSEVALGYAQTRRVSLGGQGQAAVDESAGRITIERMGANATGPPLVNTTMGAVTYRTGGTTVAYQGGGVWREESGQARMISPPEFHYRWGTSTGGDPTLTFPLVVLRGSASSSEALRFSDGPTRAAFPNASAGRQNPLDAGSVRVTIRSDYYRAWADYFETRTDADSVTVIDANRSVEVVLSVPTRGREIRNSIAARSPTVTVQGGATVDSYNSSEGTYPATRGENGSVYVGEDLVNAGGGTIYGDMRVDGDFEAGGGIDVEGQLIVDGDADLSGGGVSVDEKIVADGDLFLGGGGNLDSPAVVSGRVVETGGGVTVNEDVKAGGDYASSSGTVNGDVHVGGDFYPANGQNINGDLTMAGTFEDSGVWPNVNGNVVENGPQPDLSAVSVARNLQPPTLQPIDHTIETRLSTAAATNDNAGSDADRIEAGNCGGAYADCTLTNGTYYLDEMALSGGDHLTFDTSGGPIYLVVDGDVSTTGGSPVDVTGSNRVHVYATGDYEIRTDWTSVGDRGDQIWLYGTSESTVTVQSGANFYGVIYAPGNQDVAVRGGAEVYGGVVGGVSDVQGGTAVHYDTVLADQKPVLTGGGGAPVTFLHISVNEIRVEDG
ncbi:DUF7289 family protein [Haloplanus aerogenes]|uniref:DUF7305 domain-containing protein n=1 Tax=Haloplanus aerogenes TaxID=660522 RepID=A0A3M0D0E4_9EURY|nr:hypothetical protein [Haloplanus aerogenes]AZH24106.1 hypothetical protein DU502_01365 [Haloplanus aerogenes]RMB13116.1 hypothetical protein ATH50_2447 [Haloplanus aerogenes]